MSDSYLRNKRQNGRILTDKGLTPKHRFYEVRSISHSGGEGVGEGAPGPTQTLDLSKLMAGFIDMVDRWVEQGIAPPPSRSDWAPLGSGPALAFPEVACPIGVYYPYPNVTAGNTAFAPFDGEGVEPLDRGNVFVDMNRNGVWDERETVSAAWRRLGLLRQGQELTQAAYVACVQKAADDLRHGGFFSDQVAQEYVEQAKVRRVGR
jgi:hypothetical protein